MERLWHVGDDCSSKRGEGSIHIMPVVASCLYTGLCTLSAKKCMSIHNMYPPLRARPNIERSTWRHVSTGDVWRCWKDTQQLSVVAAANETTFLDVKWKTVVVNTSNVQTFSTKMSLPLDFHPYWIPSPDKRIQDDTTGKSQVRPPHPSPDPAIPTSDDKNMPEVSGSGCSKPLGIQLCWNGLEVESTPQGLWNLMIF